MERTAYKRTALMRSLDGREQVQPGVGLDNIPVSSASQGVFRQGDGYVLADEDNARFGRDCSNTRRNLNSAPIRQADIQQDNVRAKLLDLLKRFLALGRLANYFQVRVRSQDRT